MRGGACELMSGVPRNIPQGVEFGGRRIDRVRAVGREEKWDVPEGARRVYELADMTCQKKSTN